MQGDLSNPEIDALLLQNVLGHMGCTDGQKPYVFPMAFVYHDDVLYGQTTSGQKLEILRKNPLVCFQVQTTQDGWWQSVLCWGEFNELDFTELKEPERITIVKLLTKRIGEIQHNIGVSVPFSFTNGAEALTVNNRESVLYRIVITEKSGRWYKAENQES